MKPYPGLKIKVSLEEIKKKRKEPFLNFNKINVSEKAVIANDMKKHGFREDAPAWIWLEEDTLTDGYTRIEAAEAAGLTEVWVEYKSYRNEHEALEDARKMQINRRNMKDSNYFQTLLTLIRIKSYYYSELDMSNPENYSSIELDKRTVAGWLNVDETKAYRMIQVLRFGSLELHQEVLTNKRTIYGAFVSLASREKMQGRAGQSTGKKPVQLNQGTEKTEQADPSLIREEGETLYFGNDWLLNYNPKIYLHPDKKVRKFFIVLKEQVKALADKIFRGGKE